jgi:hypothetical protein
MRKALPVIGMVAGGIGALLALFSAAALLLPWNGPAVAAPRLGPVTRVVVLERSEPIEEIADRDRIDPIASFVNDHRAGWRKPWYGVPIPRVRADLYDGDSFRRSFGVGPGFFETHFGGDFFSMGASPEECRRFLELLGVEGSSIEN